MTQFCKVCGYEKGERLKAPGTFDEKTGKPNTTKEKLCLNERCAIGCWNTGWHEYGFFSTKCKKCGDVASLEWE